MASQPLPTVKAIVGANIKAARKRKGLNLRELGNLVDVSEAQVWRWEKGKHLPLDANLIEIAKALDVEFADLIAKPGELAA